MKITSLVLSLLAPCLALVPVAHAAEWSLPAGRLLSADIAAVHDCGALVLIEDVEAGITAVDAATGAVAWFVQAAAPLALAPVERDGWIVLTAGTWCLLVDARDGSRAAQVQLPAPAMAAPISDGDALYVADARYGLTVFDLSSASIAWSVRLPGGAAPGGLMLCAAAIVVQCGDGSLRGWPTGVGVPRGELWIQHPGSAVGALGAAGERVLLSTFAGSVVQLDGNSGKTLRRYPVGGLLDGPPSAVGGLLVASTSEGLVGMGSDGPLWTVSLRGTVLGARHGRLLVGLADGSSQWLSLADGSALAAGPAGAVVVTDSGVLTLVGGTVGMTEG